MSLARPSKLGDNVVMPETKEKEPKKVIISDWDVRKQLGYYCYSSVDATLR